MIFLWALWGAVVDFRYQKNGGTKPTKRAWFILAIAVAVSIARVLVLWFGGAAPLNVRDQACALGMAIVIVWEFSRWQVRFSRAT